MKSVIKIIIITTYVPSTLKHVTHLPTMCGWNRFLPKLKRKAKDTGTEYEWNICQELCKSCPSCKIKFISIGFSLTGSGPHSCQR